MQGLDPECLYSQDHKAGASAVGPQARDARWRPEEEILLCVAFRVPYALVSLVFSLH